MAIVAGSAVRARFGASDFGPAGTRWFAGVVTSANDDGTFAVQYNDGDYEDSVLPEYIQSINEEEEDPEWQPVSAQAVRKGGRKRPLSSESKAVAADRRLKMAAVAAPLATFADGHHLHLSSKSSTGYLGVTSIIHQRNRSYPAKPFKATGPNNDLVAGPQGRGQHLGSFATAIEAAVAYAKHVATVGHRGAGAPGGHCLRGESAVDAEVVPELHAEVISQVDCEAVEPRPGSASGDGAQRLRLQRHMRDNRLSVADVLRMCASMMDGAAV